MCIITVMKMIREIKTDELNKLLELYTHLHELGVPEHLSLIHISEPTRRS